jgi:hypothetical protein
MKYICQLCRHDNCNIIYNTKNDTLARYGLLDSIDSLSKPATLNQNLIYCDKCQFCCNTEFAYENVVYASDAIIEAAHFSPKYIAHQKLSAKNLSASIDSPISVAVEIGAGAGIFLNLLDAEKKIAIEPSSESKRIDPSIQIINDYFTPNKWLIAANLVVMRQVLEHINQPAQFLKAVLKSFDLDLAKDFHLYIEVPNSELTFKNGRFYDYYYEHCNYFTRASLMVLASELGLHIAKMDTDMDGELISVLFKRNSLTSKSILENIETSISALTLAIQKSKGKKILAWGASGNGVTVLNRMNLKTDTIKFVIDSDINKHGKYLPGTLQKIISPSEARNMNPDLVIVFTQLHKTEITQSCKVLFGENIELLIV